MHVFDAHLIANWITFVAKKITMHQKKYPTHCFIEKNILIKKFNWY